jgi:RHS repeat-associated protein
VIVTLAGSRTSARATKVAIDYASFDNVGGAGWGSRLHLVQLPACVLTTPEKAACQVETDLNSTNDPHSDTVSATLPSVAVDQSLEPGSQAPSSQAAANPTAVEPTESQAPSSLAQTEDDAPATPTNRLAVGAPRTSIATPQTVVAAVAGASGSQGNFQATNLSSTGSWTQSGATGSFDWTYPIASPPPGTGGDVAPNVALGYDSGSVDGQITTSNNQSSWLGEGWDYNPGYIERTYRTCATDSTLPAASQTQDLCWAGQILTLHAPDGTTSEIIQDDATGTWHLRHDNGERLQMVGAPSATGAYNNEYWVLTTTDGTQYSFGRNILPGGTSTNATKSAWTVPVYGAKTGDSCHASTFATSKCTQAWRWNLDFVQDAHHNAAAYYYTPETNYYGPNKTTTPLAYTRGGYLSRIDYGLTNAANNIYAISAPDQIKFTTSERCLPGHPSAGITCSDAQFTTANANAWPDTPIDQNCASTGTCNNHAPTFWSRRRLTQIETDYYTGTAYQPVDTYVLAQDFSTTGDSEMRLDSIVRTGHGTGSTTLALPPVSFTYGERANRVEGYNALPSMIHERLTAITAETGAITTIHYSGDDSEVHRAAPLCTASTVPSDPAHDTAECFPVNWIQPGNTTPTLDWFHKYVVVEVDQQDPRAIAPTRITTYNYLGGTAWHYDDNEVTKPKERTYGQFRGYGQVETRTGNPNSNINGTPDQWTLTTNTYFRGMDGDTLPSGTRSVTVSDSLGTTYPDTDDLAGSVLETQTYNGDGGAQVTNTINTYAVVPTGFTRARTGLPALTGTKVEQTSGTTYTAKAAGGSLSSSTATSFDSLGRPTRTTTTASGVPSSCTLTTYADNSTTWVRSSPDDTSTFDVACPGTGSPDNSHLLRETRTYYDTNTTLGVITAGDPTEVDAAKSVTAGTPNFIKTTNGYDSYGRTTSTTQYNPGATPATRTTTTAYTPAATGPTTKIVVTNAATQTTTQNLEGSRGLTTSSVDVAGHTTSATYDPLGRATAVWKPGQVQGTDSATVTYSYLLTATDSPAVTTNTLVDRGNGTTPGYVKSVSISDAFGAPRQTQTAAPGGGTAVTDNFNDSHGWSVGTNDRWSTTGSPSTTLVSTAVSGINDRHINTYDGVGRLTTTTEYNGTTPTRSTQTVYGGDRTTVIPPSGGVETTSVINGAGTQAELDQYTTPPSISGNVVTGGTFHQSTYSYDAVGQQVEMTTAAGTPQEASWTTTYDLLGRPTTKTDPDTGTTTTTYYDTGEVASTTDATNRVLAFDYDALGRKLDQYAGSTSGTRLASWTYDSLQAGTLTKSVSYVGANTYTVAAHGYDAYGNSTGTDISLGTPGFLSAYNTTQTWTKTHLLATKTLANTVDPGGAGGNASEKLTYFYDGFGDNTGEVGLNSYLAAATYSPYQEPSQYVLGTNDQTGSLTYTRDPETRDLTEVNLSGQTAPPQIEDVKYSYDQADNPTKTVDTQGAPGAATETTCYGYDALAELNSAWSATDDCADAPTTTAGSANVGGPEPYWTSWGFDAAGSRTEQTQHGIPSLSTSDSTTTYSMSDPDHAHALSSSSTTGGTTSSSAYTYNADGSMDTSTAGSANLAFSYADTGLLDTVTSASGDTSYVHDADGNVLLRTDPNGDTTLYLPGQQVTRVGSPTGALNVVRYYTVNGTNVALRVNRAAVVYVLADPHGTGQTIVDPTASTWTATRQYLDPYGNAISATTGGPWPDDRGFLDKPVNTANGLADVGAREYDPTTGRFTSVDPVLETDPLQTNGYSYAANNPMTGADPTGLNCDTCPTGWTAINQTPDKRGNNNSQASYSHTTDSFAGYYTGATSSTNDSESRPDPTLSGVVDPALPNYPTSMSTHRNWWVIGGLGAAVIGLTALNLAQGGFDVPTDGVEGGVLAGLNDAIDGEVTAAETGASVSSRVAAHLDDVKSIANEHGLPLNKFGDGYLWANKDANLALHTPEQLAAVQERGFTPAQVSRIRDYYGAVDEASGGANPSASYRRSLMQYYLDNWGG